MTGSDTARLLGCIPILCTPFLANGALDQPSLEREVEFVLAEGARAVAVLAIAGEGYKLTEAERDTIVEVVAATVGRRIPVIASVDGPGAEPAIDRAGRTLARGADALMVLPPSFVKPDPDSLVDYYRRIAAVAGVSVIVQDAPQLTGVSMSPALWVRLRDEAANIRYVKAEGTPQGTTISETLRLSNGRLAVFCGWGGLGIFDALERGAVGSVPAPNFTRLFAEIQDGVEAGDRAGAEAAFRAELPFLLWTMQSIDHSVAAAKEELRRRGVFTSAQQRQPAVRLDEIACRQLTRYLDARLGGPEQALPGQ